MRTLKLTLKQSTLTLFLAVAMGTSALAASSIPGVGNFLKVDDHVYRGAQPTDEGFRNLAKAGIKTVIDLREPGDRSVTEERIVKAAGMQYISIPMKGMETPSNASVLKALALLEDTSTGPVFVHCLRGADRTGGVIACYRVEHDGWKAERAVAEARSMGMSWYQRAIQNYVLGYHPRLLDASVTASSAGAAIAAGNGTAQ